MRRVAEYPLSVSKRRVLVLTLSIVALILTISACGANDDPFSVEVVNDTTQTVVAHPFFGAAYGAKDSSDNGQVVTVTPGQSFPESMVANLGTDPDRLTTLSGKTLGCLPFQFSENPPTQVTVKVTQMVKCRNWGYEKTYPKDWPDTQF